MTEIEAKDWLKAISCTTIDGVHKERRKEALFMGMQALEKQIAKKPIVTVIENTNCRWVRCSCCNETLVWMYPKPMNYCQNCGTKLDWGNEDAE